MNEKLCWEFKGCTRPCPVKDTESLFCWRVALVEGFQSPETCALCDYRVKWMSQGFSLQGFIARRDRRRLPRGRKRVLVVDDEPNILYALEETVRAGGHDCLCATDGEEALFLARETRPDLIISDVIMPKLNGYELCETVKADGRTRHIPVILVTVRGMVKDIERGERSGADSYLVKPFHAHELEEKIGAFLSPRRGGPS